MSDFEPLFTIGIPTFNRVSFLRISLAAAFAQQCESLEIIVSDNGSDDGTEEFCRGINDPRFRYVRSEVNHGPSWNFGRCLELARGRFFSWLQDDDLIFPDFARRAAKSLESTHSDCYLATAIYTAAPSFVYGDGLYSPPLTLDWGSEDVVEVPFSLMAPLSLCVSVAIPPVVAFRTNFLRAISSWFLEKNTVLYAERLLLVAAAQSGRVVAAPHVAGMFRQHPGQFSATTMSDRAETEDQWNKFTEHLQAMVGCCDLDFSTFQNYAGTLPDNHLRIFISSLNGGGVPRQFSDSVLGVLTSEASSRWPNNTDETASANVSKTVANLVKHAIIQIMPPIALAALRSAKRRWFTTTR